MRLDGCCQLPDHHRVEIEKSQVQTHKLLSVHPYFPLQAYSYHIVQLVLHKEPLSHVRGTPHASHGVAVETCWIKIILSLLTAKAQLNPLPMLTQSVSLSVCESVHLFVLKKLNLYCLMLQHTLICLIPSNNVNLSLTSCADPKTMS